MKYKILLFLVFIINIYGCTREDYPLDKAGDGRVNIELLKARFHSDSIAFSKSNLQPDFNFRQSLKRRIMWDKAIYSTDGFVYIPVKLSLPSNQLATFKNGSKDYGFKVFLRIDPKANIPQYELLTFFPDEKSNAKIFSGVVLTDDYFVGQTTYSIYPINNSLQIIENSKMIARLGEEACARAKVGEVCVGNYCSPRYEKVCEDKGKSPFPEDITEEVDDSEMAPGGGGGNGNQDEEENIEIIDSLKGYPCAQEVLKKLPNLENKIAQWLKKTFNNPDYDLTFRAITTMADSLDGYYFPNNKIATAQTITLNGNMLLKASQEYIIATMYHEALHSFLYMEELRLKEQFGITYTGFTKINLAGSTKFLKKHQEYSTLLKDLANAIKEFNPAISDYDAMALAKGGVISDMNTIESSINYNHKNGKTGTKCNP
ncbi:hypothetical protein ACR79M_01920 [Sphingobacterium spiritivorum]|uniref:hypothetical protein n=1 Tax=Sphingobacterium spiritivorum TaxID=258 RepID=UPI003DA51F17